MAIARPLSQALTLRVPVDGTILNADLAIPVEAHGIVLFAHGSGSSRHSPRNQFVARVLQQSDFGTLLMDLLTETEEAIDNRTREKRFDITLLARRLTATIDWLSTQPSYKHLPVGVFGASTGSAAALVSATQRPDLIKSVVSRGGRPDLAGDALPQVKAPTLLIVGGWDDAVLALNEQAKARMKGEVALKVVPRATHQFEEPGALAQVADLAAAWFWNTLKKGPAIRDQGSGKA
ncbi:MAG TPA: alpha/beta family hydrolase [Vicinamibacterales bacterium]|nr:alpha/beta family hydrolase [Vicinamibacterales bacterium]